MRESRPNRGAELDGLRALFGDSEVFFQAQAITLEILM